MGRCTDTLEVPGYQVIQYLGSGARSTIWQIQDRRTGETLALKRVVKRQSADERFLEQALNEYEAGQNFDHPAIRRIHQLRKVKRWLALREIHLIMEFCEGRTIQDISPRSIPLIVRVFDHVAHALTHMNSRGYVHADMKPNNILLSMDKVVKVIDLGQSCPIGTVKERIQGTPDFIAPEQVRRRPLDVRTDVYNFGAALYWTLTGQPVPTVLPRKGKSSRVTVNDLEVTPPVKINPDVPPGLNNLVMDCVQLRPADRLENMDKVQARLSLLDFLLEKNGGSKGPAPAEKEG